MGGVTFNFDAPLINLAASLQRSVDSVGHALQAIDAYRPTTDRALPTGAIAAMGVSTESHVPGVPIALQFSQSTPIDRQPQLATTWVLQKAFSDVITLLSTFILEQHRLFLALETLKRESATMQDLHSVASLDSKDAIKFDHKKLPAKLDELRKLSALDDDTDCLDLEARLRSIASARNCLEHRGGVVAAQDCEDGSPFLALKWIALDMTDGASSDTIKPGEFIGTMHINLRTPRKKSFPRGELIVLSAREYVEVCWTVKAYAETIHAGGATKLRNDPVLARLVRAPA
jgi:hypothetical protein